MTHLVHHRREQVDAARRRAGGIRVAARVGHYSRKLDVILRKGTDADEPSITAGVVVDADAVAGGVAENQPGRSAASNVRRRNAASCSTVKPVAVQRASAAPTSTSSSDWLRARTITGWLDEFASTPPGARIKKLGFVGIGTAPVVTIATPVT